MAESEHSKDPPIFLFGFARSGTTLFSMMVGAHPSISLPLSVTGLWYRHGPEFDDEAIFQDPDTVRSMINKIADHERIKLWNTPIDVDQMLSRRMPHSYPDIIEGFHATFADSEHKPLWANNDIATLTNLAQAYNWFPNAKFVHLVRDGRDVALSHQKMNYSQGNILEIAQQWSQQIKNNMEIGSIIGPDQYLIIRYEDLILQTEDTLQKLCDFLGVNYSDAMLKYHKKVDQKIPDDKRYLWPELNKDPQKKNVYRWKQEFSGAQQYVFQDVAGETLASLGYEKATQAGRFGLRGEIYYLYNTLTRGGRTKRLRDKLRPGR